MSMLKIQASILLCTELLDACYVVDDSLSSRQRDDLEESLEKVHSNRRDKSLAKQNQNYDLHWAAKRCAYQCPEL